MVLTVQFIGCERMLDRAGLDRAATRLPFGGGPRPSMTTYAIPKS